MPSSALRIPGRVPWLRVHPCRVGGCAAPTLAALLAGLSPAVLAADTWTQSVGNTSAPICDGFGAVTNTPANKGVESLRSFNGHIYAAVGQDESGSGNPVSLWRSSDLTNWSQVGAGAFSNVDVDVFSMEADGASRLFVGTHATTNGANIYRSTDGSTWSLFNPAGSGFVRTKTSWASHMVVANGYLFAGVLTASGNGQVWRRPSDASALWTKVGDFQTGAGFPGALTNIGLKAFYLHAVSNTLFMSVANPDIRTHAYLYQSTDASGTNWVPNTAAGNGFGDTNNLNLACLVDFGGYLYATVHNPTTGGQIWRTPLSNALGERQRPMDASGQQWVQPGPHGCRRTAPYLHRHGSPLGLLAGREPGHATGPGLAFNGRHNVDPVSHERVRRRKPRDEFQAGRRGFQRVHGLGWPFGHERHRRPSLGDSGPGPTPRHLGCPAAARH